MLEIRMGYLGLDSPAEKEENIFKRLFWPGDHAGEADSLGQQGLWVCFAVGLLSSVVLTLQGQWIIAIISLLFFLLGGMGVREHSTPAAVLVAMAYTINQLSVFFLGRFPGFLGLAAMVLLIANIRGTWIAAKWKDRGDPEAFPERMNETFQDKLVDQLPAKLWPKLKVLFYIVAAIYLLLTALGTAFLVVKAIAGR